MDPQHFSSTEIDVRSGSVLSSMRLDTKKAAVTGAGRGIGRGCAIALAAAGASKLILVGRSEDQLRDTAIAVESHGAIAEIVACDLSDVAHAAEVASNWDIDVLVNNAGTNEPANFLDVTPESFDRVLSINLRGMFFLTQAVVRTMIANHTQGSIINISSQMGHVGARRRSVYCASKHAVEGFTQSVALEFGREGIRVNSVAPTFIRTPLTEPFFNDTDFLEETEQSIPIGRVGRVDEVTGAVVFLASEAASLITGSCLMLDGGWTAQ